MRTFTWCARRQPPWSVHRAARPRRASSTSPARTLRGQRHSKAPALRRNRALGRPLASRMPLGRHRSKARGHPPCTAPLARPPSPASPSKGRPSHPGGTVLHHLTLRVSNFFPVNYADSSTNLKHWFIFVTAVSIQKIF
jgi:hypothetical protein